MIDAGTGAVVDEGPELISQDGEIGDPVLDIGEGGLGDVRHRGASAGDIALQGEQVADRLQRQPEGAAAANEGKRLHMVGTVKPPV